MKQRDALNRLYGDIIQMMKEEKRVLIIALSIFIAISIVLMCAILQIKTNGVQNADEAAMLTTVAAKKPSEHIVTRTKLKEIPDVVTFEDLLNRCTLTDADKHILREHYINEKSFLSIAMEMGYSEDTVKHRHQKILKKIKKLL